jgi:hypothetical protein
MRNVSVNIALNFIFSNLIKNTRPTMLGPKGASYLTIVVILAN